MEQEQLTVLVEQATNSIERAAREYQRDLIAWQVNRAADVAEKRLLYFEQLNDTERENALCAKGHAALVRVLRLDG